MHHLRFRQIHLDFHTSPHIPGIGERFDKAQWQNALKTGHVDSITTFSKCHHGWSYHPTKVGRMHPHLKFDLLRSQFDAAKEIDVNVPIYLSAGVDDVMAAEHPEWREINANGQYQGWNSGFTTPGFRTMCFNSPYLDYLCEQIKEVAELYPNCDGIFLDIISQGQCCCKWCMKTMEEHGWKADKAEDRQACADLVLQKYYERTTAAARHLDPNMPIFHNSGHIAKGNRGILKHFSHLELESLPTGGWGYDHYPLSAKYALQLGLDVMGMTGKFHTTWGEFGGYKHPNALRYECAAMLAYGSKCSIGDQLHPNAWMDESTYSIVGAAYKEVEEKEPWCDNVTAVTDIAILSSEAEAHNQTPDTGAGRVLLEEHFLFDVIDRVCDFSKYKLLILPDVIAIDVALKTKIDAFLAKGGKLFLTGKSGLLADGSGFAFDIGADYAGESPNQPNYLTCGDELKIDFITSPLVMYAKSQQIKPTSGKVLSGVRESYFNRTWEHYCSHQHTPDAWDSDYAGAVHNGNILYLAHPIFSIYQGLGAVTYRQYAANAIRLLLGDGSSLATNMPSTARVSLMRQDAEKRYVLHLLYANTISRGGAVHFSDEGFARDSQAVEVIEELLPLARVTVELTLPESVTGVTLEPQGLPADATITGNKVVLHLPEFTCHQMISLAYG